MSRAQPQSVRRRRVFYIPGYDPFPPRRYRELYRSESAKQATISGYDLHMQAGLETDGYGWRVQSNIDGQRTDTQIEVLIWSDIVQQSFHGSVLKTYAALVRTAWIYIATGALFRLMRLRRGPVIAALYPVVMLIAQLGCAVGAGVLIREILLIGLSGMAMGPVMDTLMVGVATLIALVVFWMVLQVFRKADGRIFAYYLMHDFAHSASEKGAYPAALARRLDDFAAKISNALEDDIDEVLVVGHSSGAHLAVSALAKTLRQRTGPTAPALSFLSLGHVVPMISFLPDATHLRRDLRALGASERLTWVDVSAPGDGCCFALCDPVGVSGQSQTPARWPLVFSAAFTQSLSPARWRALRWRFFRLHFQYLCAFDRPKDYDYFQITAGPKTLGARYLNRPPSKSRVSKTLTPYTSVAP